MVDHNPGLYHEVFHSTGVPMLITDTNFMFRDINTAGLDLLGYEYDEIVGESVGIIAGDTETYHQIVEELAAGETWSGEFVVCRRDDRVIYGNGFATPIVVDDEVRGFLALFLDNTKQQQYESTSEVLNRLLRHDLRNELNVIYGYTQQIEDRVEDEQALKELRLVQDRVLDIVHKSERARNLRDLLERSHGSSNRPVRLDVVLQNAVVDAMIEFTDAEFEFGEVPTLSVVGDDLLGEALECLLENAVEHNDKETATVEVGVERDGDDVVVRVADNGPGVPEDQRDLIFGREEYDQLHHGTGISLFFADSVISSYNGDIWVEDNDDEGAVFCLRLEVADEDPTE
ncbi:PAS domain-containing protein [Haloferax elongans ATCC BAA-1513]|uniref:histidine kinase n=1 Tax=Haloferax elongans ATCC BAA-1513 TaxID=1230453 RepID=M0HKR6_HALEO|nr:PAS domain-containing sensor histidine kinase [Haloferax elongans]ELZ85051.1 PAS domain-containing protein [Haloferax elongans ATCC BAA-1513]